MSSSVSHRPFASSPPAFPLLLYPSPHSPSSLLFSVCDGTTEVSIYSCWSPCSSLSSTPFTYRSARLSSLPSSSTSPAPLSPHSLLSLHVIPENWTHSGLSLRPGGIFSLSSSLSSPLICSASLNPRESIIN